MPHEKNPASEIPCGLEPARDGPWCFRIIFRALGGLGMKIRIEPSKNPSNQVQCPVFPHAIAWKFQHHLPLKGNDTPDRLIAGQIDKLHIRAN